MRMKGNVPCASSSSDHTYFKIDFVIGKASPQLRAPNGEIAHQHFMLALKNIALYKYQFSYRL